MAISTNARRRGQMLSNRRNVTGGFGIAAGDNPKGRTDVPPPVGPNAQGYSPITYGAKGLRTGYAKVGQARNQGVPLPNTGGGTQGGAQGGALPTLNQNQREMLQSLYGGNNEMNYGINAAPGNIGDMRRLMRQGMASGLRRGQVNNFLNPEFYRQVADPYGGGRLLRNLDPTMMASLAKYAGQQTGQGAGVGAGPADQAAFFEAFPELHQQYMGMANVYKQAPSRTDGMSTTPPNAVLGSDGKYHDPNKPLPPGVTLTPPDGATAPLTQPVDQVAEAGHGTPQAAINAGKDPTKHQAYWAAQGWDYNEATDQWTNRNAPQTPGQTPPTSPGPLPGASEQAGAASPTMPLDPAYIAAQRAAQLQLNSTLQGVDPALEQINAQNQLALARMNTNQGVDTQALMEALSARGALQSSIYGTERGNLATNYMRTGQDLAADVANAQSQVYQQQQGAYNDYYAALIEALLASAQNSATSEYTPVGRANRGRNRGRGRGRGNNRGGR